MAFSFQHQWKFNFTEKLPDHLQVEYLTYLYRHISAYKVCNHSFPFIVIESNLSKCSALSDYPFGKLRKLLNKQDWMDYGEALARI